MRKGLGNKNQNPITQLEDFVQIGPIHVVLEKEKPEFDFLNWIRDEGPSLDDSDDYFYRPYKRGMKHAWIEAWGYWIEDYST